MKACELKIDDKIKIINQPSGFCMPETREVFFRLIARGRRVRIGEIKDGVPWFQCRFRDDEGIWQYHSLAVYDDGSWVK